MSNIDAMRSPESARHHRLFRMRRVVVSARRNRVVLAILVIMAGFMASSLVLPPTPASAEPVPIEPTVGNPVSVAAPPEITGAFHPVTQVRIVDSRPASKVGQFTTPWGRSTTREIIVAGVASVPADATSVAINVTGVGASVATYLTVWPTGELRPTTSNVNLTPGDVRPNLVMAKIGANRRISVYNCCGTTDVVIDLLGWYGSSGSYFTEASPTRIWDTRPAPYTVGQPGKIGQGQTKDLKVTGVGGIPDDATAVVMNVTAVAPTLMTYLTVFPTGQVRPSTSSLNVPPGDIRPNLVVVEAGTDGMASFYNHLGKVDVVVDIVGWFGPTGAQFTGMSPRRLWDTRPDPYTVGQIGRLFEGTFKSIKVTGVQGVPSDAKAVVVNITGVTPDSSTFLTAWPAGETRPNTSNVNLTRGSVIPNLAVVKVGSGGKISVYNDLGTIDVVVDVIGWYA